jgi:oxygen-independent coproporphyrinogen-3 oxidase
MRCGTQWDLNFSDYFAEDLKLLAPLAKEAGGWDEKGLRLRRRAPVDP